MGFIIRSLFWLSLVLLLIPFGQSEDEDQVSAIEALHAAGKAAGDLAAICERQPEVCETGKAALKTIGARARESARMALEALGEENTGDPASEPVITGSTEVSE